MSCPKCNCDVKEGFVFKSTPAFPGICPSCGCEFHLKSFSAWLLYASIVPICTLFGVLFWLLGSHELSFVAAFSVSTVCTIISAVPLYYLGRNREMVATRTSVKWSWRFLIVSGFFFMAWELVERATST